MLVAGQLQGVQRLLSTSSLTKVLQKRRSRIMEVISIHTKK